jgi:protein phosphatase
MRELVRNFKQYMKHDQIARATVVNAILRNAVHKANLAIVAAAAQEIQYRGMGTTIVAAVLKGDELSIAHVGDSRLYRLRDQQLKQLTVDHSVLQELIDCGFYTKEQAQRSPNRHIVTRALGVSEQVEIDVQNHPVLLNDIYLLCSDGLHDMLNDHDIANILNKESLSLEQLAQELVQTANIKGGFDNISVILLRVLPCLESESFWHKFKDRLGLSRS